MQRRILCRGLRVVFSKASQRSSLLRPGGPCELSGASSSHPAAAPHLSWTYYGLNSIHSATPFGLLSLGLRQTLSRTEFKLCSLRHFARAAAAQAKVAVKPSKQVESVPQTAGSAAKTVQRQAAPAATTTAKEIACSVEVPASKAPSHKAAGRSSRSTASSRKKASKSKAEVRKEAAEKKAKARARAKAQKEIAKLKALAASDRARAWAKREKERRAKEAARKAKAKEKEKEANRIKRPPHAFNLFVKDQATGVNMLPGTAKQLFEAYAKKFKELPEAEKQKYLKRAAIAKAEVDKVRDERKKAWHARHAMSPYMLFFKENYGSIRAANPGLGNTEVPRKVYEAFLNLSPEAKQKYVDMSEADRRAKGLKPLSASGSVGAPALAKEASALA